MPVVEYILNFFQAEDENQFEYFFATVGRDNQDYRQRELYGNKVFNFEIRVDNNSPEVIQDIKFKNFDSGFNLDDTICELTMINSNTRYDIQAYNVNYYTICYDPYIELMTYNEIQGKEPIVLAIEYGDIPTN